MACGAEVHLGDDRQGLSCWIISWEGLVGSAMKASGSFHFDARSHPNTQLLLLLQQKN